MFGAITLIAAMAAIAVVLQTIGKAQRTGNPDYIATTGLVLASAVIWGAYFRIDRTLLSLNRAQLAGNAIARLRTYACASAITGEVAVIIASTMQYR